MTLEVQFHRVKGRVEASAELHWYAQAGFWRVNILGFGKNQAQAKAAAEDMARQARTALQIATIDDSVNRVPETRTEGANERSNRPQHAD
jgi:hypothetical protein